MKKERHHFYIEGSGGSAVIIIPGISGGVLTKPIYQKLAARLQKKRFVTVRCNLWKEPRDLNKLTVDSIYKFLDAVIAHVKQRNVTEINIIAKSFGGGIMLTYVNPLIKRLVLWAPAIGYGENSNFASARRQKLETFRNLSEIRINRGDLTAYPCLILHASDDTIAPVKTSQMIVNQRANTSLMLLEKGGHSFRACEKEVIKKSIAFIDGKD